MQSSREDNASRISPNLLQNFNVYEILEPQRSNNNNGPVVDTLIDLNDNSNHSTLNPEMNASFIDKTTDYELIDLFQNIFVSPQQIKKKETKSDEIKHSNIDYKDFFDKLESGDKIDWSATEKVKGAAQRVKEDKPTSSKATDFNDTFNIKAKVLVPTIHLDSDSDQEDYVDQRKDSTEQDLVDQQKDLTDHDDDLIYQLLSRRNIEKQILSQIDNSQPSTSNLQNNIRPVNDPVKLKDTEIEHENIKETSRVSESTQLPHLNSQISNSLNDTFVVKAIIKDEKAYRKNRIVKSDGDKKNYTKGPDFNEKQIVLPQIMRRLTEREKALSEEKSWKKRLILDSGTSPEDACPNCSKSTDSRTMNSPSNITTKPAFNSLIQQLTANSLKTAAVSNSSADKPSKTADADIRAKAFTSTKSVKPNPPSNPPKYPLNSTPVSTSLGLNTSKQGLSSSKSSTINSAVSNGTGASSSDGCPLGTFEPVVLMEDCNKERLLAWKRGQMISNLVRTGKLHP